MSPSCWKDESVPLLWYPLELELEALRSVLRLNPIVLVTSTRVVDLKNAPMFQKLKGAGIGESCGQCPYFFLPLRLSDVSK